MHLSQGTMAEPVGAARQRQIEREGSASARDRLVVTDPSFTGNVGGPGAV